MNGFLQTLETQHDHVADRLEGLSEEERVTEGEGLGAMYSQSLTQWNAFINDVGSTEAEEASSTVLTDGHFELLARFSYQALDADLSEHEAALEIWRTDNSARMQADQAYTLQIFKSVQETLRFLGFEGADEVAGEASQANMDRFNEAASQQQEGEGGKAPYAGQLSPEGAQVLEMMNTLSMPFASFAGIYSLVDEWGFQSVKTYAGARGFQFQVYTPKERAKEGGLLPVVSFRGTASSGGIISDVVGELVPLVSIGSTQFYERTNRAMADNALSGLGVFDVTGHSLGGALAQLAAIEYMGQVQRCVTFQSPGLSSTALNQYRSVREEMLAADQDPDDPEQLVEFTHHFESDDVVDLGGSHHLGSGEEGTTFNRHFLGGSDASELTYRTVQAHLNFMLQGDNGPVSEEMFAIITQHEGAGEANPTQAAAERADNVFNQERQRTDVGNTHQRGEGGSRALAKVGYHTPRHLGSIAAHAGAYGGHAILEGLDEVAGTGAEFVSWLFGGNYEHGEGLHERRTWNDIVY